MMVLQCDINTKTFHFNNNHYWFLGMKYTQFIFHNVTPSIPTLTADTISAETVMTDAFKAAWCIRARSMRVTIVSFLGTFVYICNNEIFINFQEGHVIDFLVRVCVCVSAMRFTYSFGQLLRGAHTRTVNIMKVYTERNSMQVELIRFRKKYRLYWRWEFRSENILSDRRVYETIHDVSPLFCACSTMCLFDKRQFDYHNVLLFTPFLPVYLDLRPRVKKRLVI